MKNYFSLILLLFIAKTWAQDVHFEVTYLPNHSYLLSKTERTTSIVDLEASEEIYEALETQGIKIPIVEKESSTLKSITTTGDRENDKIPVKGEFLEFSQAKQLESSSFYGFFHEKRVHVDSLSSDILSKEQKQSITIGIQSVLNAIYFPDKKMNIGDTLVEKTKLNYPVGETTIPLSLTTIYKLKATNAEKSFFDIIMKYDFMTEIEGFKTQASGSGIGSVVYDIKNKFITQMLLDTEVLMDFNQDGMLFHASVTTELDQTVEVKSTKTNP
ncbi:hypothetical protein SAMN04487907_11512 [Zunongwangia mangrovi]|uniref:Uncharacterized protein n=1 Tax=Zunongwangia mangrovi TaxID=1334022 RepID=A0A1I1N6E5_9FLAO|nr:hypothetical protein [Zunongwangia mangrovi]SFC92762.1 hypothetical protein SAMN04487907_11512 [Zunongwangia mangrovi]